MHGVLLKQGNILCCLLTCLLFELQKELLVKDEGHAADFFHFGLRCGVPVDEVSCNSDGQFTSKLFAGETWREGKKNLSNESCKGKPMVRSISLNGNVKSSLDFFRYQSTVALHRREFPSRHWRHKSFWVDLLGMRVFTTAPIYVSRNIITTHTYLYRWTQSKHRNTKMNQHTHIYPLTADPIHAIKFLVKSMSTGNAFPDDWKQLWDTSPHFSSKNNKQCFDCGVNVLQMSVSSKNILRPESWTAWTVPVYLKAPLPVVIAAYFPPFLTI